MEAPLPVFKRTQLIYIYNVSFCVLAYLLISSWPQTLGLVEILVDTSENGSVLT